MVESRTETGKIEEEIRTNCGSRKKRKLSKIYIQMKKQTV